MFRSVTTKFGAVIGTDRRSRKALTSTGVALVQKVANAGMLMASIPLALRSLGAERYGVWVAITSLQFLLVFADMGLGGGVVNTVSNALARDDEGAALECVSTATALLGAVAVIGLALFAVAYPFVNWAVLLGVRSGGMDDIGRSVTIAVMCFTLGLPLSVAQRVQYAFQQGYRASAWQSAANVISFLGTVACAHFHRGLAAFVWASSGGPLLAAIGSAAVECRLSKRWLTPRLTHASWPAALDLLRQGAFFAVMQTCGAAIIHSDNLVIARWLGASTLAAFSIPSRLFSFGPILVLMVVGPLWPAYSEAMARKDFAWVKSTVRRSLLAAVVTSAVVSGVAYWAGALLTQRWIGKATTVPGPVALALAAYGLTAALVTTLNMFLNGAGVLKPQAICLAATAAAAVALKIWAVQVFGIPAVPLGSALAQVLIYIVPLGFVTHRILSPGRANDAQVAAMRPFGGLS